MSARGLVGGRRWPGLPEAVQLAAAGVRDLGFAASAPRSCAWRDEVPAGREASHGQHGLVIT